MKVTKKLGSWMVAVATLAFAQLAWAGPKTLIELDGTSPTPGLASAWKKVADGQYEFTLDTTKEIAKDTPVSVAAVKDALETKLGSAYGVKVADKGSNVISVAYTGDEATFLQQVAKTKVRGSQNVELALDSSVSQGGIRANPGNRNPNPGEVKATVLKVEPGVLTVRVTSTKAPAVANGAKVKINSAGSTMVFTVTKNIFFKPLKAETSGVWDLAPGSLTDK